MKTMSCLCATCGRTDFLEESLESFLRQDYGGPKELIILNDLPGLTLEYDHPEVRVINADRFPTLGDKRNELLRLAAPDSWVLSWDDDDIHLPWRLDVSRRMLTGRSGWQCRRAFIMNGDNVARFSGQLFGAWAIDRAAYMAVGGYDSVDRSEDTKMVRKIGVFADRVKIPWVDVFYLYRWSGHSHISVQGADSTKQWAAEHAPRGDYTLKPCWRRDYADMVRPLQKGADDAP